MQNNLQKLSQLGQSPWYDNIDRSIIQNGELQKLFSQGIMGVTTNPSIFEKAIKNNAYNNDIVKLKSEKKTALEIYNELTIQDVAWAADALYEIYEKTSGRDGYVSIEVLPEYAYDIKKTIENARQLFAKLNRKNIMIKIPATKEGVSAIQELIGEGININATLIFSISQYEAVANAYIAGLNNRIKNKKDIKSIHSVASVFVSRVDACVDNQLKKITSEEKNDNKKTAVKNLCGRIAIANIKVIYARYKEIFSKKKDINTQRILWASTSTKNPEYNDIMYVQELIAKESINTIPHETLIAFLDHGNPAVTIENGFEQAKKDLKQFAEIGLNLDSICQQLQDDGVKAFQDAFIKLIETIKRKQCQI